MPEKDLTLDEVRMMAAEIGMTRLTDESLQMLLRATKASRARRAVLSVGDLTPADEPAHVYTLDTSPLPPLPRGEGNRTAGNDATTISRGHDAGGGR